MSPPGTVISRRPGIFSPERLARTWFSAKYYNSPMPYSIFFHRGYAIHGSYEISNLGEEPLATWAAPAQSYHGGGGPGLVDEDELARIKPRLLLFPLRARQADVLAVLLGGVQAFF